MALVHTARRLKAVCCHIFRRGARKEPAREARGFSIQMGQAAATAVAQRERQYRSLCLRREDERRRELLESRVADLHVGQAQRELDERAHFEAIAGRFDKQAARMDRMVRSMNEQFRLLDEKISEMRSPARSPGAGRAVEGAGHAGALIGGAARTSGAHYSAAAAGSGGEGRPATAPSPPCAARRESRPPSASLASLSNISEDIDGNRPVSAPATPSRPVATAAIRLGGAREAGEGRGGDEASDGAQRFLGRATPMDLLTAVPRSAPWTPSAANRSHRSCQVDPTRADCTAPSGLTAHLQLQPPAPLQPQLEQVAPLCAKPSVAKPSAVDALPIPQPLPSSEAPARPSHRPAPPLPTLREPPRDAPAYPPV